MKGAEPRSSDEALETDSAKALIEVQADGMVQIGPLQIDAAQQTIQFPAEINMTEDQLEYVLVGPYGKLHESLLNTDVSAFQLQTAALLLGLKAPSSGEAFETSPRISIDVIWNDGVTRRQIPIGSWIWNASRQTSMNDLPWIYNGSRFEKETFVAERDQSFISLIKDRDALINHLDPDHDHDDIWVPHPKDTPAKGTKVTIEIKKIKNTQIPQSTQE